jgi:SagB-type dehydrogenase family enzyme
MERKTFSIILILMLTVCQAFAQASGVIALPEPKKTGGMPLFDALNQRQSLRSFTGQKIDMQTLSNILWAAYGVNRPDGKRTVPVARNWNEYDIYVVMADGWYIYEPGKHELNKKSSDDRREYAGRQDFVHTAPLTLIYVADYERMPGATDEVRDFYSAVNLGYISQNVYLCCASEGLGTCVLGQVDRDKISEVFNLRPGQRVVLSQVIGYPD